MPVAGLTKTRENHFKEWMIEPLQRKHYGSNGRPVPSHGNSPKSGGAKGTGFWNPVRIDNMYRDR